MTLQRVAAALSRASGTIRRNGLAYETWFSPIGDDVSAWPMDPICAIATAVAGAPHGLGDDDWALADDCVQCAVIAAAAVAFATHIRVTEHLIEDGSPIVLTPHAALVTLVGWLEADHPPVSDVAEALEATAADLRGVLADAPTPT